MKKQTKRSLTRKLDVLCSKIVRKQGICAGCSMRDYEKLQCAHIYSRKFRSIRWDLDNLICLCSGCHFAAHQKPLEFAEFVKNYLGVIRYNALKLRANAIKKWTLSEMQEYYDSLNGFFVTTET